MKNDKLIVEAQKLYLPDNGEGNSLATQCVTAVSKLLFKWLNDGDVYDNVHSSLQGWANDLSSYANWLYLHNFGCDILDRIYTISSEDEYEELIDDLCGSLFQLDNLGKLELEPVDGTIYDCTGPFEFMAND